MRHRRPPTDRQLDVLGVVAANGPVTPADVAYHLPIGESSARAALRGLESKGLIDATYTAHVFSSARAYVITARGADALAAAYPEEDE